MEAWCEAVLVVVVVVVVVVVTVVVTVVVGVGVSVTSRTDSRQALKVGPTAHRFKQGWLRPPSLHSQPLRYLPTAPQQVQLHNRNLPVRFIEFGIARATKRLRSEFPTSEQCSETFG